MKCETVNGCIHMFCKNAYNTDAIYYILQWNRLWEKLKQVWRSINLKAFFFTTPICMVDVGIALTHVFVLLVIIGIHITFLILIMLSLLDIFDWIKLCSMAIHMKCELLIWYFSFLFRLVLAFTTLLLAFLKCCTVNLFCCATTWHI